MSDTTNYGLKKPGDNDYYDVKAMNANMDIIDTALKAAIPKSLATAADQTPVSNGVGSWIAKTLAEFRAWLGLGSAAYTASTAYATASQGTKADNALLASSYTQADVLAKVGDNYFKQSNYGVIKLPYDSSMSLSYANAVVCVQAGGTMTFTVPTNASVPFPDGTQITFIMGNTNASITFAPEAGVNLYSKDSKRSIDGAFGSVTLIKLSAVSWILVGALK